jgi:hypothetical protein
MSAAIDRLNDANLNRILEGFSKNDQLYRASYLGNSSNRLVRFLERTTNKRYVVAGRTIQELVLKVPGVALENAISFLTTAEGDGRAICIFCDCKVVDGLDGPDHDWCILR